MLNADLKTIEFMSENCSRGKIQANNRFVDSLMDRVFAYNTLSICPTDKIISDQNRKLCCSILDSFVDTQKGKKVMLHIPHMGAIKYLFQNWATVLSWMGVETFFLSVEASKDQFQKAIDDYKPDFFISCDVKYYTDAIDFDYLAKRGVKLKVHRSFSNA